MKKYLVTLAILCMANHQAKAYTPYRLTPFQPQESKVDSMPMPLSTMSTKSTLSDKAIEIKPHTFKEDMTYAGIPLFVAGIIAKSEKASFRQNYDNVHSRTRLVTNFHNEIDNYTQYAPFVLAAGLNFTGVEGRSDHARFLASSAMAYGIMAAIVNPIKYSAKEMRPDGSTRNS